MMRVIFMGISAFQGQDKGWRSLEEPAGSYLHRLCKVNSHQVEAEVKLLKFTLEKLYIKFSFVKHFLSSSSNEIVLHYKFQFLLFNSSH